MAGRILAATDTHPQLHEVVNYPGYYVSNDGRVWTLWTRRGQHPSTIQTPYIGDTPREMVQRPQFGGYVMVSLFKDFRRCPTRVQYLILDTFVGQRPPNAVCRHLDGNPRNNNADNLCWGTQKENMHDMRAHRGMWNTNGPKGQQHGMAKLKERQVREIRARYSAGETEQDLAGSYGVTAGHIRRIVRRILWKHI